MANKFNKRMEFHMVRRKEKEKKGSLKQSKKKKDRKFQKRWDKCRTQNHIEEISQNISVITGHVNGITWANLKKWRLPDLIFFKPRQIFLQEIDLRKQKI